MDIDAKYLELSFEGVGVRNSQKRLKGLIADLAVNPLRTHQNDLRGQFDQVEAIVMDRIAAVIAYWAENKHDPVRPHIKNMMSDITNASKNDVSLEEFYRSEVKYALYSLAPAFELRVPEDYEPEADQLEYALLALDEAGYDIGRIVELEPEPVEVETEFDEDVYTNNDYEDAVSADFEFETAEASSRRNGKRKDANVQVEIDENQTPAAVFVADDDSTNAKEPMSDEQTAIVSTAQQQVIKVDKPQIQTNLLDLSAEQAWQLIYGLIGSASDYIQETMLPRWQQSPDSFDKDRRFLYGILIDTVRNAAGVQHIAGNYMFDDGKTTVDQLWHYYFADLSRNVGPVLAAAKLHTAANDPAWKKFIQNLRREMQNVSIIWLLALGIALVFDGLTTYVSLDQTPMNGPIVAIFTLLITALFQIADQLVISYRKREFEAEAMVAKYHAQYERLNHSVETLEVSSDSYVQLIMERSRAHSDWKAADDNRKMARRGRFWSARIADINVVVTAYGFAYLFLDSSEPMYALAQQVDYLFVKGAWEEVDVWVFLMIALAVTVSFVVNTAQRTEILGWSMRRLKNQT